MSPRTLYEFGEGGRFSRDPNELHFIRRVKCHMLHAVVARTTSLCTRDILVTGDETKDKACPTFRNRTMMGSSLRSSRSLAATSIENTLKTDLMSAE